jgi:hypothetical protein
MIPGYLVTAREPLWAKGLGEQRGRRLPKEEHDRYTPRRAHHRPVEHRLPEGDPVLAEAVEYALEREEAAPDSAASGMSG